jgi:hypothetical protein
MNLTIVDTDILIDAARKFEKPLIACAGLTRRHL